MNAGFEEFELPAEPFEEYMRADDRPQYPMSIHMRLHFAGSIQREPFLRAWQSVLAKHPLLRASLRSERWLGGLGKRWKWVGVREDAALVWEDLEEGVTAPWPHTPYLDLENKAGVCVWVQSGPKESWATFHLHHASADGLGTMQALRDLLHAYHAEMGGEASRQRIRGEGNYAPEKLRGRGTFGLTAMKFLKMLPAQASGFIGAIEFLSHRTGPLVPVRGAIVPDQIAGDFPSALSAELSSDEFTALRRKAKEERVTVNDLMLRDLFQAITDWRDAEGIKEAAPYIRLSVPMSLRETKDRDISACNIVSMVFLDRKREEIADRENLLRTISDQMQLIKNRKLGYTFIWALKVTRWLIGGIPMMAKANECRSTAVLSNLAEPFARMALPREGEEVVTGNLRLKRMEALAPIRPLTQATFVTNIYAGRLTVSMHFDSHQIQREQAERLLATFMRQMRYSVGLGNESL